MAVPRPTPSQPIPAQERSSQEPVASQAEQADQTYSQSYGDDAYLDDEGPSNYLVMDPNKMGQAYDDVRADSATQWAFSEHKVTPPPEWMASVVDFFTRNGSVFRIIIYLLIALFALFILYLLFPPLRNFVDSRLANLRAAKNEEAEEDWAPHAAVAVELLQEADKLAAEGRYAEAVHLLLGRSIEDIGRRRPQLLRPALTARDIARSPDLPDAARGAFTTIANVVELSHFGRRPVDAAGWQQCRDAYSRFALRESWSAREQSAQMIEAATA